MLELGSNVLANIIAAVIIAILGWIFSIFIRLPFIYRKRKRLFQFFGITKDNSDLIIYLSTVYVQSGGSVDFRGTPRTFHGPAVPASELQVIEPIVRLFSDPFLDSLPKKIRQWLDNIYLPFQNISPIVIASPQDRRQIRKGNIFTIGSQYYNSGSVEI